MFYINKKKVFFFLEKSAKIVFWWEKLLAASLIVFREALEAVLIIGFILAILTKKGLKGMKKQVWVGAGLGILLTAIAAVFFGTLISLPGGNNLKLFEGTSMLVAAAFLTMVAIWASGENLEKEENEIEEKVQKELSKKQAFGLGGLAFISVAREGLETVFLVGVLSIGSNLLEILVGALVGLAAAIFIGRKLVKHSLKLDLKKFFTIVSVFLVLFSAGLVAHGIGEFQEAGAIKIYTERAIDASWILPNGNLTADILSILFGYNATPSILEITSYIFYLVIAGLLYFFFTRKKNNKSQLSFNTLKKKKWGFT